MYETETPPTVAPVSTANPLANTIVRPLTRKLRTNHLAENAQTQRPLQLKPLAEQVIVITGASSGIGLVTARLAAQRGARLVLAARSAEALERLAAEINAAAQARDNAARLGADDEATDAPDSDAPARANGPQAVAVTADVSREEDINRIVAQAQETFGGFDTWVNNAGISIYGPLLNVPLEEQRRLFDTNFWGLVQGSLVAARHLSGSGGALINVGSVLSDRAIPLQGTYCASKHAVKGFTDALRMELEHTGAPVSVTLIKPSAINTPYKEHAKNYLENEPNNPPPVYAPETVAEGILHAATTPVRDLIIGGGGRILTAVGHFAPRLMDRLMNRTMFAAQHTQQPARMKDDGLYQPSGDLQERGNYSGHVAESSVYTQAVARPWLAGAVLLGAGLALTVWRRRA